MKKVCLCLMVLTVLSCMFLGCSIIEDKNEAESIPEQYFEAVKNGEYDRALEYYATEFFKEIDREDWLKVLTNINLKLGNLQDYDLENCNLRSITSTGGKEVNCDLIYEVTYSDGKATEIFKVIKKGMSSEYKIFSHDIQSVDILLKLYD